MNMIANDQIEATQGEAKDLALDTIVKIEGHNPRRIRAKSDIDDMRESIRNQGVLQSILVRPHPTESGKYQLVAGETRYDLALEVGLSTIPTNIRHIPDDQLKKAAATENLQRNDMSPIDEGQAAQQLLADGYDKDEVCRIMGWNRQKLDGRIQLTHCCDEVGQALIDKKITIGHAQLLSGLREKVQADALALIQKKDLTVDQFRAALDASALKIASATFDTTECGTCPHNSSTQATLFEAQTSNGRCLNKTCFERKTNEHMAALKTELTESYNTVALSHEVAKGTAANVMETGKQGVGTEQLAECAKCENFGAVINTSPGSTGKVVKNVCFNVSCLKDNIKAYQDIIATDATPATTPEAPDTSSTTTDSGDSQTASKPATKAKPKAKASKPATPKSIVAKHHTIHREAAAAHLNQNADHRTAQIMALLAMMQDANLSPEPKPENWPYTLSSDNRAKAAMILDTYSDDDLTALQLDLATRSLQKSSSGYSGENGKDTFGSLAEWYSANKDADLTKHFVMDSEYLSAFTKPVIGQLLEASGFAKHHNEKADDDKAFKALIGGKKGDIIQAVKDSDFDFTGFIPDDLKIQ